MEVGIIIDDDKPATREMQYSRCVVTKTLINISQDKNENSLEIQHIIYDHGKKSVSTIDMKRKKKLFRISLSHFFFLFHSNFAKSI